MEIFVALYSLTILLINPNFPTTLKFNEEIEYFTLGNMGDFNSYLSKDKKILVLTPKKKFDPTPLVVITSESTFQFLLKESDTSNLNSLYLIYKGNEDKKYVLIKETPTFRLLEGVSSLLLESKVPNLEINFQPSIKRRTILSKGSPLYIQGRREH